MTMLAAITFMGLVVFGCLCSCVALAMRLTVLERQVDDLREGKPPR